MLRPFARRALGDIAMSGVSRSQRGPNRSLGGQRWTIDEDERLLELVKCQREWREIAIELKRTFASVQNRFRFLKKSRVFASEISPLVSTRAQDPTLEPDFTCGALSAAGRKIVEVLCAEMMQIGMMSNREPSARFYESRLALGGLIRAVMLGRHTGWLRITLSKVSAPKHGISRGAFANLLISLEKTGMLERYVGYLDDLNLKNLQARKGRPVYVRATALLQEKCERQGISSGNLFTHFPSLDG